RKHPLRQRQGACAGELAAGYAYRGHWHSVRDAAERERIRVIENEEWHHRALVGAMLRARGAPAGWPPRLSATSPRAGAASATRSSTASANSSPAFATSAAGSSRCTARES